jgi:hypothetical protein
MSVTPTFTGEVQMRRYSDTSSQGVQVTFALHDREALEPLVQKAGKRFMAVLVEIGDDEQPVQPAAERAKVGPLCREAVGYCQMPDFQQWLPLHTQSTNGDHFNEQGCRDFILGACGIASRKELDASDEAAGRFVRLIRLPFMRYMKQRAPA